MNMTPEGFKAWRRKLRLTQEQAAAHYGVTRVTLQNWENNVTPLPYHAYDLCGIIATNVIRASDDIPVTLLYTDGPVWVDLQRGRATTAIMETMPNSKAAVARARDLSFSRIAYSTDILDEDMHYAVYTNLEIKKMIHEIR